MLSTPNIDWHCDVAVVQEFLRHRTSIHRLLNPFGVAPGREPRVYRGEYYGFEALQLSFQDRDASTGRIGGEGLYLKWNIARTSPR